MRLHYYHLLIAFHLAVLVLIFQVKNSSVLNYLSLKSFGLVLVILLFVFIFLCIILELVYLSFIIHIFSSHL